MQMGFRNHENRLIILIVIIISGRINPITGILFWGSAWEKDTSTNQFYYHKFDVRMADLNWKNPVVANEIQKILQFWLNLGIDGFRMDVINFLTTDGILMDNPMKEGNRSINTM